MKKYRKKGWQLGLSIRPCLLLADIFFYGDLKLLGKEEKKQ
ncbi:Putative protein [Zobellia galactanivorans]|uniref:Uncharacterized protein n=1 Tax=Zobellia galactanivorans (strain DSM 12802 / CCUG 47099 / CIP 106680 / NCIMB 13871 / Dsij) TaxID=63186 RepID=G0L3J9_ZOBGA|nr:Putative protein [Zobellia galactanivorans]